WGQRMKNLLIAIAVAIIAMPFVLAESPVPAEAVGKLSPEEESDGFKPLFNGKDLSGWWIRGDNKNAYLVKDGVILVTGEKNGDWLFTDNEYDNFALRYEYRCVAGEGNSGVGIRATKDGNPAFQGMEIQVLRPGWETPYQRAGSLYHTVPAGVEADKKFGEWNSVEVYANGPHIRTTMNGTVLYDIQMTDFTKEKIEKDAIKDDFRKPLDDRPAKGLIGLQNHEDKVEFRNIRIKLLDGGKKKD
ncbi:MAG TPA: DUF1080 domain-containing protein, partial [Candidatus Hydrogenedentes bacterium]|nr:DUF1080 domain-containing protein [Candidatus Hydrogenedentota bacterium]